MRLRSPILRLLWTLALPGAVAGCSIPAFMSYPPQVRGNTVDADSLKELVVGTSTRADASALLGSPTAKATFDDNIWIYIGQVTRPVIAGTNTVLDQQVVALTFDETGVLRNVDTRTAADSLPVTFVSRTTPSPGSEASILQQLLGNVGRFSTGSAPKSGISSGSQ